MTMSKGPAPDKAAPANVEAEDDDIYEDESGKIALFVNSVSAQNNFVNFSEGYRVGDIYIPPPVKPYCSTESTGPRLIITNISNHNFKSYAGTVVLGPFHQVNLNSNLYKNAYLRNPSYRDFLPLLAPMGVVKVMLLIQFSSYSATGHRKFVQRSYLSSCTTQLGIQTVQAVQWKCISCKYWINLMAA